MSFSFLQVSELIMVFLKILSVQYFQKNLLYIEGLGYFDKGIFTFTCWMKTIRLMSFTNMFLSLAQILQYYVLIKR